MLSDLMDGGTQLFIYEEGIINIEPYGSTELSFSVNDAADISSTEVLLSIWPHQHEYALKELYFIVTRGDILSGDVNSDGIVNILDVVTLVNMVLSNEYNPSADINNDGVVNVLDVVGLVNIILSF